MTLCANVPQPSSQLNIIWLNYIEVEERAGSLLMAPRGWWVITSVRFILAVMRNGGRLSSSLVGKRKQQRLFSRHGSTQIRNISVEQRKSERGQLGV